MPSFTIRTVNSLFSTELELDDQPSADHALAQAVRGAVMIAADEIHAAESAAVVEVIVEDEGRQVRRSAVCVSVAPLATGAVEERDLPMPAGDR